MLSSRKSTKWITQIPKQIAIGFIICTQDPHSSFVTSILQDIHRECDGKCILEIIVACEGGFTQKKNTAFKQLKTSKIAVVLHDYITLLPGWCDAFSEWHKAYDGGPLAAVSEVLDINGKRTIDWVYGLHVGTPAIQSGIFLPYDFKYNPKNANKWENCAYIPGNYFIIDVKTALKIPLNESLGWNQGEDVEWSRRLWKSGLVPQFIPNARVQYLKPKNWNRVLCQPISETFLNKIK